MKKFKFRLQSLLDIREKLELEQKNKLAKAASEYQKAFKEQQDSVDFVNTQRQKIFAEQEKTGVVSMDDLRYLDKLQSQNSIFAASLNEEIEQKRLAMEAERVKYIKARQEKQAVENLKKKALEKHKIERLRYENYEMDEISKHFTPDKFD